MKIFLQQTVDFLNAINEWVGRTVSWLTLLIVLLVCFNVMRRYFFESADAWGGELEWHFFALIFLLGAGYAFKHERHVRVDLFYTKYSKRDKAWTNLIGALLFLIPWCVLVIWYSWDYAVGAWEINEKSPNPNGLPFRYIYKVCYLDWSRIFDANRLYRVFFNLSLLYWMKTKQKSAN